MGLDKQASALNKNGWGRSHVIQRLLTMPPRRLLQRPNVAVALRTRAVLDRWAVSGASNPPSPAIQQVQAWLRTWAAEEREQARLYSRNPRFLIAELRTPPLTLAWVASHQESKFPGDPPVPNLAVTSANAAADALCAPLPGDPLPRPSDDPRAALRWPPGLPRFWFAIARRAPPGCIPTALRRAFLAATPVRRAARWSRASGCSLCRIRRNIPSTSSAARAL